MLATFNLQHFTLDLSAESGAPQGIPPIDGPSEPAGFAALLQLRTADAAAIGDLAGDVLPPTGNPLPEQGVAITVDGVALERGGDADTPLLPVADEQPWESLLTPPGLELSGTAPTAAITPDPRATPGDAMATLTATPALSGAGASPRQAESLLSGDVLQIGPETRVDSATLKPQLTPLPMPATEVPRDVVADARDMRIGPAIQAVAPREMQLREFSATRSSGTPLEENGQSLRQDAAVRPTTSPLPQAGPVTEPVAEPPRPVVQPGVPQATVSTPAFQPGAFASAAPAAPNADATFASALQQQVTDLIETPVREASWGDRIGERVVMMANNQLRTAEIRLTPAELGPVRIQVNVEDGAANITFQAQHAVTREAIEQALPRLREMFAENGLSLGQASVGEQNVAGNRDGNARGEARAAGQGGEFPAADEEMLADERPVRRHEGLLDTFV